MYNLGISNSALKIMDKLDKSLYLRISNKIHSLENNPRPNGSLKLADMEAYRIRVGDYRILYTINDDKQEIVVFNVSHRKESYKKK